MPTPPALADPSTTAIVHQAGRTARSRIGVGLTGIAIGAGITAFGASLDPSADVVVMAVGGFGVLTAVALVYLGVEQHRFVGRARTILAAGPWTTAGPYRTESVEVHGADHTTTRSLIAISRPEGGPLRGQVEVLPRGWRDRRRLAPSGRHVRIAGPVHGQHVLGSTDGDVLVLLTATSTRLASTLTTLDPPAAAPSWKDLRR